VNAIELGGIRDDGKREYEKRKRKKIRNGINEEEEVSVYKIEYETLTKKIIRSSRFGSWNGIRDDRKGTNLEQGIGLLSPYAVVVIFRPAFLPKLCPGSLLARNCGHNCRG